MKRQERMRLEYSRTVISFTMNIPGEIKSSAAIKRAFLDGLNELLARLGEEPGEIDVRADDDTGPSAILSVAMDAEEAKKIALYVEERLPLGRLYDIDVIGKGGERLSRGEPRGCIICGKKGKTCAASRTHPAKELWQKTLTTIYNYYKNRDPECIGAYAMDSLIYEAMLSPKPGLVDPASSGAHEDMTVEHLGASAEALLPYFIECVRLGMEACQEEASTSFSKLRELGLRAEGDMLMATGGVNTHKGAIYSMGIMLFAIGRCWTPGEPISDPCRLFDECMTIAVDAATRDLELIDRSTAGGRAYLDHGIRGIRGEVIDGFPTLRKSLTRFERMIEMGESEDAAALDALILLISKVDDTCLYNRGGVDGIRYAKERASELLALGVTEESVRRMDEDFTRLRLSPGGSADLLALTYLIYKLRQEVNPTSPK
ncbi:MAG: citrate lyase holo-[Clostridia bacterium]|nr:citrate lyase holo-[acyl-carrier protein] synthase [Clostridia bacterium]